MTGKKKRQRGSRTHGGGSQKNRRGAGHRGGRGKAGNHKHEHHGSDPQGKTGFQRPPSTKDHVEVVNLEDLDVHALYNDVETIDARDVADDGYEADVVKVLGTGKFTQPRPVIAHEFSGSAMEQIEAAGGEPTLLKEAEITSNENSNQTMNHDKGENDYIEKMEELVRKGQALTPGEAHELIDAGIEDDRVVDVYDVIVDGMENVEEIDSEHVVALYRLRYAIEQMVDGSAVDFSIMDAILDEYFGPERRGPRRKELQQGVEESMTPEDVEEGLELIEEEWTQIVDETYEPQDGGLEDIKKDYLMSVRDAVA